MSPRAALCLLLSSHLVSLVLGHGMLIDPASRNSAWRYGFDNPSNYDDNQLFCGGFQVQWEQNDGKCGVCGDAYNDQNPPHIYPGKYAINSIITKNYTQGQQIQVQVKITANHKGWFEFRIGKIGDPPITQAKLTHLLQLVNGSTRWNLDVPDTKIYTINLQLPVGLTCEHCVIQWWYNTGNSWSCDGVTGKCGLGYGKQETFVNCADVAINDQTVPTTEGPTQWTTSAPATTESPPTTKGPTQGTTTVLATTKPPPTTEGPTQWITSPPTTEGAATAQPTDTHCGGVYSATGPWTGVEGMDNWCQDNCSKGFCPTSHCVCDTSTRK